MKSRQIMGLIVVVVILLAAGYFIVAARKAPNANPQAMSPMPTTSPVASSAVKNTTSVDMTNYAFSPSVITVPKGSTVTWTNMDSVGHTVIETDNQAGPHSGTVAPGKTYAFTFASAGSYHYHCSIHPDMTGTVIVTE